jgi:hypothetical protein
MNRGSQALRIEPVLHIYLVAPIIRREKREFRVISGTLAHYLP